MFLCVAEIKNWDVLDIFGLELCIVSIVLGSL